MFACNLFHKDTFILLALPPKAGRELKKAFTHPLFRKSPRSCQKNEYGLYKSLLLEKED